MSILDDDSMFDDDDSNLYNQPFPLDEDKTVLLVDLHWSPMPESIDWEDPNFAVEITNRLRGVTEESFTKEVKLWQDHIKMLPHYDEIYIRKEISNWDISIPGKDQFDFESFSQAYALQVQYRNRLTEMHSVVFAHYEMISQAQKMLKEMAVKLAPGAKHDKDASATFTVHPLVLPMTNSKRLLSYLESILKNIDFAASQMDRMLREHQALSRINQTMNSEGMSNLYTKEKFTPTQYNKDSVQVKTRNHRII